jgi:hypothetical protein
MNEQNNKLTVKAENGKDVTINVLDIIDSEKFGKTFMIYNIEGRDDVIFASILNESDEDFSLETITDSKEIDFINEEIDRVVAEAEEQEGE